jgi:hypothetical protein
MTPVASSPGAIGTAALPHGKATVRHKDHVSINEPLGDFAFQIVSGVVSDTKKTNSRRSFL